MTNQDQIKLRGYGFTLIRSCDQHGPAIKYKNRLIGEWTRLGQIHPSKASRDRAMKELLESDFHIEL